MTLQLTGKTVNEYKLSLSKGWNFMGWMLNIDVPTSNDSDENTNTYGPSVIFNKFLTSPNTITTFFHNIGKIFNSTNAAYIAGNSSNDYPYNNETLAIDKGGANNIYIPDGAIDVIFLEEDFWNF